MEKTSNDTAAASQRGREGGRREERPNEGWEMEKEGRWREKANQVKENLETEMQRREGEEGEGRKV